MKKLAILYRRKSNPQINQSILNITFAGGRVKTLTFPDFVKNASGTLETVTEAVELFPYRPHEKPNTGKGRYPSGEGLARRLYRSVLYQSCCITWENYPPSPVLIQDHRPQDNGNRLSRFAHRVRDRNPKYNRHVGQSLG